jgi:uncharacterized protein (TIGR00255 family)
MIRSMTGYARVRKPLADGEIALSIKSLNHRGLDLHFHLPSEYDPFEAALRAAVKRFVARGHLDIRISRSHVQSATAASWNREAVEAYLGAFHEISAAYGLSGLPDLNSALRIPGMLGDGSGAEPDPGTEATLVEMMAEAIGLLNGFRAREGSELAAVMLERNAAIRQAAARMEAIRSRALPAFQARLEERLRELLEGVSVEPQRLAQEAAMLADRSDIGEEIARLKIHAAQLQSLIEGGGEVGKKLDFLLQELNRETNTVLSKTNGIGETGLELTELALAVKSDIEKIREQALNVE